MAQPLAQSAPIHFREGPHRGRVHGLCRLPVPRKALLTVPERGMLRRLEPPGTTSAPASPPAA
jgi:hypothetical protein